MATNLFQTKVKKENGIKEFKLQKLTPVGYKPKTLLSYPYRIPPP